MSAFARLLLLAALPTLAGLGIARGDVLAVSTGVGPAFAEPDGAPDGLSDGMPDGLPDGLPDVRTVVAAVGGSAALDCRVLRLGDKAVSWVRSRDLQILSHDGAVFTADARVSLRVAAEGGAGVGALAGSTLHSLRIEPLRETDSGRYECQLNTEPKMSLFFNLTVVDEPLPRVVVSVSPPSLSVSARGAAVLSCSARYSPAPRALAHPALDVRWLHDGRPVDLQAGRGGVALDTARWSWRATSTLTLSDVAATDAGRYTCTAAGQEDHLLLHVMDTDTGGPMEAMQRDAAPPSAASRGTALAAPAALTAHTALTALTAHTAALAGAAAALLAAHRRVL